MSLNRLLFLAAAWLLVCPQMSAQSDYWQQEVNYKIDVRLDDANLLLHGNESFEYINNSPNVLSDLYIHLWPNAYSSPKSALAKQKAQSGNFFLFYAKDKQKGGIDSLRFQVNGTDVKWEFYNGMVDVAVLHLPQPLPTGGSITVSTPFRVKIPSGSISRLGHIGDSFQITQWYPKPAVYDKDGWHPIPYLNQGEFYSEFGSFDVSITLPSNYIIGATGDCQTSTEVEWMNGLAKLNFDAEKKQDYTSSKTLKTVRYTQNNVHDFGWFADKKWIVRKGECVLPNSGRNVTTWALFTPENAGVWEKAGLKAIRDGLYYYSKWSGDYPYNQCTAVDGTISAGGGMEYPNVTVIGNVSSENDLATVIIHEVGHNWFYGILGSNERDHAWMDEGMNSLFETRTVLATRDSSSDAGISFNMGGLPLDKVLSKDDFNYQYLSEELLFLLSARYGADQPIDLTSNEYTNMNYGTIVYKKTALVFNYLLQYLGEDTFNRCMAAYFEKWKFKHPQPNDMQQAFESASGKKLGWVFNDLVYTTKPLDFKLNSARVNSTNQTATLRVSNVGNADAPFSASVIRDGKVVSTKWFDPLTSFNSGNYTLEGVQKGDRIRLNAGNGYPEIDRKNNTRRTAGVFRGVEPVKLSMFTMVDNPNKSQLFWNPLVGWNNYDKWMLGAALHNKVLPRRKFEWLLAPMYSITSQKVNGFASMQVNTRSVKFGLKMQQFSQGNSTNANYNSLYINTSENARIADRQYFVVHPFIDISLLAGRSEKSVTGNLIIDGFFVENSRLNSTAGDSTVFSMLRSTLRLKKQWIMSSLTVQSRLIIFEETGVANTNFVEYEQIIFPRLKKRFVVNVFAAPNTGGVMSFNTAGQTGAFDYGYEFLYFGRHDVRGLTSNQVRSETGGLYAPTGVATNTGFVNLGVEFDLPVKFPIALYGGITHTRRDNAYTNAFSPVQTGKVYDLWTAGITLPFARKVFQIWVPIFYSTDIRNSVKAADLKFGQTIMFELNLDMMNPFEAVGRLIRQ
jgi:hypothetical protein